MLSNKLTFSLASLVVLLVFALVATPVMAGSLSGSRDDANSAWEMVLTFPSELAASRHAALIAGDSIAVIDGTDTEALTTDADGGDDNPLEYTFGVPDADAATMIEILDYERVSIPGGTTTSFASVDLKQISLVSITTPEKVGNPAGTVDFTATITFDSNGGRPNLAVGDVSITSVDSDDNARSPAPTILLTGGPFVWAVIVTHSDAVADGDTITIALADTFRAKAPADADDASATATVDTTAPTAMLRESDADAEEYTGPFSVIVSFDDDVAKEDISVTLTPADKATAGDPFSLVPGAMTHYSIQITPVAGYMGMLTIAVSGTDAVGNDITAVSATVEVDTSGTGTGNGDGNGGGNGDGMTGNGDGMTTPVVSDGTASANAAGTEISVTLSADQLAAGGFIVVANWPGRAGLIASDNYSLIDITSGTVDLEDFFRFGGGTIQLLGPTGSTANDVVISEIMWGGDENYPAGDNLRTGSQWIELYVTTGGTSKGTADGAADGDTANAAATAGDWMIVLTKGSAAPAAVTGMVVVDTVSNQGLGRWNVADGNHGSNGRTRTTTTQGAVVNAEPFVSMYRDIGYINVTGTDAPKKTRKEQLDALKDGTRSASWKQDEVNRGAYQDGLRYATPGEEHVSGIIEEGAQELARDGVVFNEIANRSADAQDWIELHNTKTGAVKINGWELSSVTAAGTDTELLEFKSDEDILIPGGGYLLVVNTDPTSTSLAAGQNVVEPNTAPQGVDSIYYVSDGLKLPKTGALLVLRNGNDKIGTHEKIVDVAAIGDGFFDKKDKDFNTAVWPLKGTEAGVEDDNTENDDVTWVRDQSKALFHGDAWKNGDAPSKVTGVGIDRNATAFNSGTPGYANNAVKGEFADADGKAVYTGMITISEIMVDQTRRNLPQWIELFNASRTQAVNINGWELKVMNVNSADLDSRTNWTIKIDGDLIIAPSQTALIVSGQGRRSQDSIPSSSVYNLNAKHRSALEMSSKNDSVLSTEGFYISLSDGRDAQADAVGNIDSNARTDDAPAWALPADADSRSSIIRVYEDGVAEDGATAEGWMLASMTNLVPQTYYGDSDDMSSPGNRQGSPLPVSLSSFRPVRDKATGAVVIRWITESELNNAGFNILRSETKKGEFKVVNLKGIIAGHGTTTEKHTYEWTDTSAKPNVVYFYQIEDVSLDGERTTLRTTHLRGNVNAAGKATTTWGDLKSQR